MQRVVDGARKRSITKNAVQETRHTWFGFLRSWVRGNIDEQFGFKLLGVFAYCQQAGEFYAVDVLRLRYPGLHYQSFSTIITCLSHYLSHITEIRDKHEFFAMMCCLYGLICGGDGVVMARTARMVRFLSFVLSYERWPEMNVELALD